MAWLVGDSFDYYGSAADVARSVWDAVSVASLGTTALRFGVGQYLTLASGTSSLQKNLPTNEATLFIACAQYRPGVLSGTTPDLFFVLRDGATAQCTVVFESSGNIVLKSGIQTGTVLATYTGAFAQDVWTHFQIRVVISNTAGSMTVRKNGQTSDTYASATNLNTRAGTANNYANVIFMAVTSGATTHRIDDLLIYSGTAPAPNDWIGDVRAVCLAPAADTAQKQFTPLIATVTTTTGTTGGVAAHAPNQIRFGTFVPTRSGVVTNATITYSGTPGAGSMQVAIYADAGGVPGALLGTSAVVVNPSIGLNNAAFTGGPSLAQGHAYWIAYNQTIALVNLTGITVAGSYFQATTFAAGFPNPAGTVTAGTGAGTGNPVFSTLTLSGNVTNVSETLANGDTDYVFDATVGDADLYDVDDLPSTPASVIGVVSKIYVKKSDAGARSGQLLVSSGGTQVAGTDTVLGTTYTYLARVDAVDPATGVAWTPAAVNAVKIGQKVTA